MSGFQIECRVRGRPVEYSALAIECCLMIRQVFRLPLRQTEGFLTSRARLMDVAIAVPDYSCLSKRSIDLRLERLAATVRDLLIKNLPKQ